MDLLLIIFGFWAICKAASSARTKKKERERAEELARIKREQARQRESMRRYQEAEKEKARRQAVMEREQTRQRKEQERLAKEQERQAALLAKHEEQIAKLERTVAKSTADIEHWQGVVNSLYALLDIEQAEQAGAVPGSAADIKHQNKIITLNNKIYAAEQKVEKAKYDRDQAQRKLAA